ncbi:hypothetical protein EH30_15525 [Erythrobacter sp. JL475]|nr:hypothetical protein EH30_15525 [Erythrobacter sp. JL475]
MFRTFTLVVGLALIGGGCTTVEQRATRYSSLTCAQLATALDYEKRGGRRARRTGVVTGIASIIAGGDDGDLLELDSDLNFLEADDRRISVRAIRAEQQRRCVAADGAPETSAS